MAITERRLMGLLHCGYWVDSGYDCWRPHPLANWVTIVSTALCHVSVISKGPACQYTFDGIVQESAAQRVYLLSMHSSRWRWCRVYQIICGCEKLNCKIRTERSSVLHILVKVEQNTEHPASSSSSQPEDGAPLVPVCSRPRHPLEAAALRPRQL